MILSRWQIRQLIENYDRAIGPTKRLYTTITRVVLSPANTAGASKKDIALARKTARDAMQLVAELVDARQYLARALKNSKKDPLEL